jgi:acyl-coenzyme A synthetase/AMP-(fatty) acid ligase/rubrerythrin
MQCPSCHHDLAENDRAGSLCCADAGGLWHCSGCGQTHRGFAFAYGLCPSCNVKLRQLDTRRDDTPEAAAIEGVRLAFEIELGGRAFYQRAAADSTDVALRTLFGRFAVMEGEHMETLSRRFHVEPPAPSPALRLQAAALFAGVEHRPQDPDNLFRIALGLEQRAMHFFSERAAQAGEGSATQRLYLDLADEERAHAELLADEHARWSAGAPGRLGNDPHAAPPRADDHAVHAMNAAALLLDGQDARRTALVCHGGESLDYGELRERVARTASCWRTRGVGPGDRVAIKLPDGPDWVVAFLGTIWCGAIAVGVNPRAPAADWQYILDEAGFRLILAETLDDTPSPWRERVLLQGDWRDALPGCTALPAQTMDEDSPALWCHSSGTSGKPKAVVHAHRFARQIEQVSREGLGLVAGDRLFASSKLFFSYPQTNSLFAGLKLGATVILDPQWPTAASVAATVAAQRPTVLFSVPSLYRNLLHAGHAPAIAAAGVRLCVSAGEALPASLRSAWLQQTGLGIVNGYGASETLVLVMIDRGDGDGFAPSPGVDIQPLSEVAPGAPTRLLIRAPTLALGYLDRPQAQSEHFRDGAFCPADLFAIEYQVNAGPPQVDLHPSGGGGRAAAASGHHDGGWRFAGREDSLVKIHGRWVNLVELEERLSLRAPGIAEAAAVCVPDADGVDAVAFFFVAGDPTAVEAALRAATEAMPPHQRPRWLHVVDALPRTPTGKLLRRKLQELHLALD